MTPGDAIEERFGTGAARGQDLARRRARCSRSTPRCRWPPPRSTGSASKAGSRTHRSGSSSSCSWSPAVFNLASIVWLKQNPEDGMRIQVRLAVSTLATTAVIYAVGWGPMLVIAYGVGFAAVLQEAGSASWRSGFAWCVVGVGLRPGRDRARHRAVADRPAVSATRSALGGLICFGIVAAGAGREGRGRGGS